MSNTIPLPPPMSEADEKRLNAALTIVFDLACGPADPTMMQDELVAAAESIGMRFPAPAVREPLSDERIDEIFEGAHENVPKGVLFRTFIARAIEQAHGIGGGGK